MKKLVLFCLAILLGAGISMAAKPEEGKKTAKTVFVTDIDCEHCVKKIMDNVPSLGKGVKDVQVDLKKKEVTVTYDPTKTNDAQLVRGFASLRVKAEPKVEKPKATAEKK
ncbi:MAG: heavy-metal-associated domain-containing protein [Alistipes sp.]|nr:heavy-metal-associated domain-containing protein [Alistipes sp.]